MRKVKHWNSAVIELNWEGGSLDDSSEFEQAIGRMVIRAIRTADHMSEYHQNTGVVGYTSISLAPEETVAVYYGPAPATDYYSDDGYPLYYKGISATVTEATRKLADRCRSEGTPFTLGAVKRDDGYTFHS